jgi:oligopeptide/dipeptide ABC transporter ATP-binding protein
MMLKASTLTLYAPRRCIYPLWRVDLQVRRGERVAVVGESGGGKTSLAWSLVGHPVPGQRVAEGSVVFEGASLLDLPREKLADLSYRRLALVPQNVQDSFHPTQPLWKSAREILRKEVQRRIPREEVLDRVGPLGSPLRLGGSLWDARPHELSGGQKQRMGLVLAVLNRPRLLVLDEPTNALDELTRSEFLVFLDQWRSEQGAGIVLFTHDLGLAASWADRILVLYRGRKVEEVPASRVHQPAHPYTRDLMNAAIRLGDAPGSRSAVAGHALPLEHPPEGCGYLDRCPCAEERCGRESPPSVQVGEQNVLCHLAADNEVTFNSQK